MQVNPSQSTSGVPETPAARVNQRQPATSGAADQTSFGNSQRLLSILNELPDVRPDKVAQARQLLADPTYPSDQVLGKVADSLLGQG